MTKQYNYTRPAKPKKNTWFTVLKVACWSIGILIILAGIALWIISYQISPNRIKCLIEKESSQYLNARVEIGNLDYKLFSTYPWLNFEIDTLNVISKSLKGLSSDQKNLLPRNADSLVSLVKLQGKVNVHDLMYKKINLKDIRVVQPKVNIVMVNESISNFNIAKKLPDINNPPKLEISELNFTAPVDFTFFSLADQVSASLNVDSFYLIQREDKSYEIELEGGAEGSYKEFIIPQKVPLKFKTVVLLDMPNYFVKMNNLSLALAGVSFNANGEVIANKEGIDFQNIDFHIEINDIFTLLQHIPAQLLELVPLPEGLSGMIPLDLSARLIQPFHIDNLQLNNLSLEDLPAMTAVVKVDDANITYHPRNGKKINADDVFLEVICEYDPSDPQATNIELKNLRMHGEGVSLAGNAHIDNIMGESQNFEGNFSFKSPVMETIAYLLPQFGVKFAGYLKGDLEFSGKALNLGKNGLKDIALSGDVESHDLKVNSSNTGKVNLKNFKGNYTAKVPAYPLNNYSGTKLDLDFSADSVAVKASDMNLLLGALKLKLDAMDTVSSSPDPYGLLSLKVGDLNFSQGATSFKAEQMEMKAKGSLNATSSPSYPTISPYHGENDSIIYSRTDHTPTLLIYSGGGIVQTLMTMVDIDADFSLAKASFKSPAYLYPFRIENVRLFTDLNKLGFSASKVSVARTTGSLSGRMEGLKPFIISSSATPLKAKTEINFKNVDINQLSWGYYGALIKAGSDSAFYVPPMLPFTAADSVCVVIPRNIDANISLRSDSAEYMQYHFAPLSTDIIMKDGVATLNQLTVGTPYCTAIVDWTYSTSQLDNIFMDLKADVKNFRFAPFYKAFPTLTEKASELHNFTGAVNAHVGCYFNMFPVMFMNEESLRGDFNVEASDLQFVRKGKIEHITHLMMIEGDEPIHIHNIDVTGSFHDNILQLNPFKISFDGYQLGLAGMNNTAGDMYYHISLEKSPFHMPFGVSVFGKMKHPEFRLGGTHIDDYRSETVTTNPDTKINANIMAYLKHGWLLFIQEAAKYEGGVK